VAVSLGKHGLEKPDPAAFQLGVTELGVAPEEIWFVGDSLHEDVLAAHVGMTPVLVDRQHAHPGVEGVHRITSLDLLPRLWA
jgi:putative hydrolase of the HAD superfamily